jgi:hypothetical protein
MADTRPPPAAGTPSASALVGPYPIDEDALRKLKRLHDDGVIDDDEFKRGKAEALGLAEPTASSGALLRLPEDLLRNVLSFLVVKQEGIAQRFLDNVMDMQHGVLDLHAELEELVQIEEDSVYYQDFALELVREGDVCAKKIVEDVTSCFTWWPACREFTRHFRRMYPDLRSDLLYSKHSAGEKNRPSRAVKLKWSGWDRELHELSGLLEDLQRRLMVDTSDVNAYLLFSHWEDPHVHVLELMAPFDGLDETWLHS